MSQDQPIVSSISNAGDQVTNALGQFWQLVTSSNQKSTGADSKVVKINELPLYSEDNAPLKQKFIPEEPLPLQREFATIRVACEEEYASVAERFKVADRAVTETKKEASKCQQYLTHERTALPKAASTTVRGCPEEPLQLQNEFAAIRVAYEEEYSGVAEHFKVADRAVTETKKEAAKCQQYLTDEWTALPKAAAITVGGTPEGPLPLQRELATIPVACEEERVAGSSSKRRNSLVIDEVEPKRARRDNENEFVVLVRKTTATDLIDVAAALKHLGITLDNLETRFTIGKFRKLTADSQPPVSSALFKTSDTLSRDLESIYDSHQDCSQIHLFPSGCNEGVVALMLLMKEKGVFVGEKILIKKHYVITATGSSAATFELPALINKFPQQTYEAYKQLNSRARKQVESFALNQFEIGLSFWEGNQATF